MNVDSLKNLLTAAHFAAEKHCGQLRKGESGEPYINHPIEVAHILAECLPEPDAALLVAALLHDTVEDTSTTREEIAARFGEDVAALVSEVTDDKSLPKERRKALQVENAPHKSPRAQNLKAADKISNLRSILISPPRTWSFKRKREYFDWAKRVVDRLGLVDPCLRQEFERVYAQFPKNGD